MKILILLKALDCKFTILSTDANRYPLMKPLSVLLIFFLLGCSQDKNDEMHSNLILQFVYDNKTVHVQDTGIPIKQQEAQVRVFREMEAQRLGVIDISYTQYLYMNVYQGQPCVVNMSISVTDGERGLIFDFYNEGDGSYLYTYHFVPSSSLTYLGVQLSGNRLYMLNGDGEIVIFELTFG